VKTDEKSVIRVHYGTLRESFPPEQVAHASAAICQLLAAWPVLTNAKTVLTYLAFNNEVDLSALFTMFPSIAWVTAMTVSISSATVSVCWNRHPNYPPSSPMTSMSCWCRAWLSTCREDVLGSAAVSMTVSCPRPAP